MASPEELELLFAQQYFPDIGQELENYINKWFSPTGDNQVAIEEIFKAIKDASDGPLSQKEQDAIERRKYVKQQFGDAYEAAALEDESIVEMQKGKIDVEDGAQLLQEIYYKFAGRYENLYGEVPSSEDTNFGLNAILDEFLIEKKARQDVAIREKIRPDRTQENIDAYKILDILDGLYESSETIIALQPLYFTEASRMRAFLETSADAGYIDWADTKAPDYLEKIYSQWNQIQFDMFAQSTAANPALKTMSKSFLFKANGVMGSKQDRLDYGYINTINTDSPLTKEQFKTREEARSVETKLTEDDLKAIMSNPHQWLKDYYGNTLTYDFQTGTSPEAKESYDRFIKEKGDLLKANIRDLRAATDAAGGLVYSPDEILKLAGAFADNQFADAPSITGIDEDVAYAKEKEEFDKRSAEAQAQEELLQDQRRISDYNIFQQAQSNPDSFKKKYLDDPVFASQVDDTLKRYREEGIPEIDAATGKVKVDPITKQPIYTGPQGMTPSGKIKAFPDVTYRDPNTGEIKVLPAAEVPFHLGPGGLVPERLKPMLNWQYNLSPADQWAMQSGGAPPSLPPNIMQSLMGPPSLRSDIYTTDVNNIRRPFFPNLPEGDMSVFNPMFPGSGGIENYVEPAPVFPSMGIVNMPGSPMAGNPYASLLHPPPKEEATVDYPEND